MYTYNSCNNIFIKLKLIHSKYAFQTRYDFIFISLLQNHRVKFQDLFGYLLFLKIFKNWL